MKSINVLHVLNEIQPSGAEMMLLTALPTFRALGVNLTLLATGKNRGTIAHRFESLGVEVLHLPFSFTPRYFFDVWKLFRQPRWDAIHLHSERATFYFGLAAFAARKPTVRTVHNVFRFDGFLKWRRSSQRRALEWLGVRHVAIGTSVLENEQQRFRIHPVLISNWFDDKRFRPASAGERENARSSFGIAGEDRFVVVSVGNCSDTKNHKSLLRALALLEPERRPLYLHAGIEDADRSERALVAELGLGADVVFLGPISDVPTLLHAADAFVMPSLFEGMSIAALEAVGSGVPCILSDVRGLCDLRAWFPGVIYCQTDAPSIAQALTKAMSLSPAARADLVAGQAAQASERFGIDQGASGYSRLYWNARS